jgi:predicted NBD/HSP70 family sugar kinase
MSDEEILVGVDGGASEVRAHEVVPLPRRSLLEIPSLGLGAASASCLYDRARGFRPLPLASQLLASQRGKLEPRGLEGAQGRLWLEAAARSILAVASQTGKTRARIGVCMPGLKTKDGRGIAVIRNGPRIPDYLDRLQTMLTAAGLELSRPVAQLSSDGEACAYGEEVNAQGSLKGIACAYYIGGGTGIAEALKVDGRILGLDALRGFLRKAWQMESSGGRILEDQLSPRGMNAAYAQAARRKLPLGADDFPERRAAQGDDHAARVLRSAAEALAELVVDRMLALRHGFREPDGDEERGSAGRAKARIPPSTILGRVVIGQRLGVILADPELHPYFRDPCGEALARRIVATGDGALRKHYLDGTNLRAGLLAPSLLRAAPAIGAAAIEVLGAAEGADFREETSPAPF